MASRISNKGLLDKCKEFVQADVSKQSLDESLKAAIVTACREICRLDGDNPLAWLRGSYDNLYTRVYGEVSSVTQASPGVFDVDSLDDDITGHGFIDKDIIFLTGLSDDSMDELNDRFYRVNYVNTTTFSLLNLDGQNAVSTASLDEYDSGGYVYHAGILIPTTTIHPSGGNAWERWTIGDVWKVLIDGIPMEPISEDAALSDGEYLRPTSRPTRFRYWRNDYQGFDPSNTEHFLMFYPPASDRYYMRVFYEKSYPDPSEWTSTAYPPHVPEVHDAIWHRALKIMTTNTEKQRRESKDGRLMGKIEILYAQHWMQQVKDDEVMIVNLSRRMLGGRPSKRGFSA